MHLYYLRKVAWKSLNLFLLTPQKKNAMAIFELKELKNAVNLIQMKFDKEKIYPAACLLFKVNLHWRETGSGI